MTDFFGGRFTPPPNYTTPKWPSLYWPLGGKSQVALYYVSDIFQFTLIWTVLLISATFASAGLWAYFVFLPTTRSSTRWRHRLLVHAVPIAFATIGAFAGLVSGSVVGALLGLIYNAGYFRMSTWMPLVWGMVQVLVVIMASYSTMTTIL
ncbi:uncharacterized protein VTP21DRAFT_10547 [Calcarisporiella thermophila]|uniref:uncharacterized protein n=1 Tax=Calcarisporiella thermophila TaxID=911321 RepID=UPI003742AF1B